MKKYVKNATIKIAEMMLQGSGLVGRNSSGPDRNIGPK
jgi:hypothetical protein